jgi:hypothetical protein
VTTKRRTSKATTPRRRTSTNRTSKNRTSTSRTTRSRAPRRRSTIATTLGAGAGTVVVAFLLGAPWSVRIVLLVLVVVLGAGYLILSRRS